MGFCALGLGFMNRKMGMGFQFEQHRLGFWDLSTLGARGFFLFGDDRIERRSGEGESRSGEKKTSGTNG